MCILRVFLQRLPAVYSCIVCCIYLQILKHAMQWHLSLFTLSPYVYSLFPLSELSTVSMTFTLCNSSPQHKIIPIIVSVRFSRSDPSQVCQARGKLCFGEWRSQSTEAVGLLQKLVRKHNYDYKGQERRERKKVKRRGQVEAEAQSSGGVTLGAQTIKSDGKATSMSIYLVTIITLPLECSIFVNQLPFV